MNENIKLSSWEHLSIRIIMLFVVAMIVSFIPEISVMRSFFGDTYCAISNHSYSYAGDVHTEPTWHWGWRHWLFLFMGVHLAEHVAYKLRLLVFCHVAIYVANRRAKLPYYYRQSVLLRVQV
jgi:hypothetical protein